MPSISVPTAIAAGIGAAGSIGGALISSNASSNATQATTAADNAAIAEQAREFNTVQSNEAPFLTTGTSALDTLAAVYGLSTAAPGSAGSSDATAANPGSAADYSSFYESPDYQFALSQGLKGVQASEAANGSLESGATDKAEEAYAGNLASTNYNAYTNKLQSLAGVAQTGASTDASAGANSADQTASLLENTGNNNAAAALAMGSSYGNAIGNLAGQAQSYVTNNPSIIGGSPYNAATGAGTAPNYQAVEDAAY